MRSSTSGGFFEITGSNKVVDQTCAPLQCLGSWPYSQYQQQGKQTVWCSVREGGEGGGGGVRLFVQSQESRVE
jgi:hypothetical protein